LVVLTSKNDQTINEIGIISCVVANFFCGIAAFSTAGIADAPISGKAQLVGGL
jgi:hypothetical protein